MDFLKEDADRLLSYNTKQQVSILDRFLGVANVLIQLLIVAYIVVYVFIIDEGYLEYEQARGVAATHVSGGVVAISSGTTKDRYFGPDEITYPALENGNVFVTTKYISTHQFRGICEDPRSVCETNEDCVGELTSCTDAGKCFGPSWCTSTYLPREEYKLETAETSIWVKSAIQFFRLNKNRIFMNDMEKPIPFIDVDRFGRARGARGVRGQSKEKVDNSLANTFTVRQLLEACDPPVRFEEISELGAAIEVQIIWECNVNSPASRCAPRLRARRVDALMDEDNIGFTFSYPEYYNGDKAEVANNLEKATNQTGIVFMALPFGVETHRTINRSSGIRFYFRTVGVGHEISITAIIFKISTGIALLGFAPILTDYLMLNCFKLSRKYYARKYEISQDFSDFFDAKAAEEAAASAAAASSAEEGGASSYIQMAAAAASSSAKKEEESSDEEEDGGVYDVNAIDLDVEDQDIARIMGNR